MIYHLSLRDAGIAAGAFLVLIGLPGLVKPDLAAVVQKFPRSRGAGIFLLTVDLIWTLWLLATIEMGEFSAFRRPLLIAVPIAYVLALRFVDEFLVFASGRTISRCGISAAPIEPFARNHFCLSAHRRRTFLGDGPLHPAR